MTIQLSTLSSTLRRSASWLALLFAAAALLSTLAGCTRNNGDIGQWFGRWQITEITVDGAPESGYGEQVFIDFQNNIVRMTYIAPDNYDHSFYYCFGTWEQPADDTLIFDFTHSDDNGTLGYTPFGVTHFPVDEPFRLSVADNTGKKCRLIYNDASAGHTYTYTLVKR